MICRLISTNGTHLPPATTLSVVYTEAISNKEQRRTATFRVTLIALAFSACVFVLAIFLRFCQEDAGAAVEAV